MKSGAVVSEVHIGIAVEGRCVMKSGAVVSEVHIGIAVEG